MNDNSCANCKHEEKDISEHPCCECVDNKDWVKFGAGVTLRKWELDESLSKSQEKHRL